ncbi:MAG: sulfatase [Candidatus Hydrogenedentes bacterium]|nr:sulfatase [Candidatus Hydrogenedentota bacterium]
MNAESLDRRAFLQAAGCAFATTALSSRHALADKPLRRPNVLFIAIDDLNDWIGCLGGHPGVKTPHLDALAGRGLLFTNAHCPAPLCNASRAALMTGIRPSTSGIYENDQPWRGSPVLREAVTIPQHFSAHGYRASGSGKIYHGSYPDPPSWDDYWPSQRDNIPPTPSLDRVAPGGSGHFTWGPLDVPDEEMGDWKVADWVSGQLARDHDQPFFLACGFYRPHLRWEVPRKYFDLYPLDGITLPNVKADDLDDVPEAGRKMARPSGDHQRVIDHDAWRQAVQGYLASISFADARVGQVIAALDAGPNRENTIVALWSDHGWHLGEKLHWRKFALWEEATHNVLMMTVPGVTQAGSRCPAPVNLLDLYPTLIDLCGLSPLACLEGTSLAPLLKDPEAHWERPTLTTFGKNNHSVRSARWRYIRYADGSEELYDHASDEMEWTNLASDEALAGVKKELAAFMPELNRDPVASQPAKAKRSAGDVD